MRKVFLLLFLSVLIFKSSYSNTPIQVNDLGLKFSRARSMVYTNSDSAIFIFKNIIEQPNCNDTTQLKCCIQLCKLQGLNQNFSEAFDYAGQALKIAEQLQDTFSIITAKGELGVLYKEFGKENISREYLQNALDLTKILFRQGKIEENRVSGAHFGLAMHYRWFNKFDLALAHLDTCQMLSEKFDRDEIYNSYHLAEMACIYTDLGKTDTSKIILHKIENLIVSNQDNPKISDGLKGFITIIYFYIGNAYLKENQYEKSVNYYRKSLCSNEKYGFHNSSRTQIWGNLSIAYSKINNHRKAYECLLRSKELGDAFFGATSKRNNSLVEIKNKYKEEVEKQKVELLKQETQLTEQKQSILFFRSLLIGVLSIIFIGYLLYRNRKQRNKYLKKNEEFTLKQQQSKEELELKNKELTAFTLKLIEKEEMISSLIEKLKETSVNDISVKSLVQNINAGSDALWEEFNSRFIEVNSDFYERLQQKHPDLSPTERKHCALIKLNFSGKEMARLLNISVTSVHVSRYRLRKRFELNKGENLTDFISRV